MSSTTFFDMAQVMLTFFSFSLNRLTNLGLLSFMFFSKVNSKLDELSRLNESEYESNKTVSIFQYFDKIYTICYGTSNFQTLIDALIQRKYPSKCDIY